MIHQPSSDLFRMFDRIWLLDTGGYPIFDGPPLEAILTFRREIQMAGSGQAVCRECGNVHPDQLFHIIEMEKPDAAGSFSKERQIPAPAWTGPGGLNRL